MIEIERPEWEELAKIFPPVVWKYRDWADKWHKSILTELQVYLAAPTSFEDKLDCKNPLRYDLLTDEQIRNAYFVMSEEEIPGATTQERIEFANYWFDRSPLKDKDNTMKQQELDFKEYDQRTGILSLTANPTRSEMWEKYSNKHTGFCVGFNSYEMFRFIGGGGPVTYVDELPVIMPYPITPRMEIYFLQVHYKLKVWEFEEEYRGRTFSTNVSPEGQVLPLAPANRVRTLSPESYKEIIFGAKMPDVARKEIMSVAGKRLPDIEFKVEVIAADGKITIEPYIESSRAVEEEST